MPEKSIDAIEEIIGTPDAVVVRFTGPALDTLADLKRRLGVDSPQEVVLQAVRLLASARGKEVLLRSGETVEVLPIWQHA